MSIGSDLISRIIRHNRRQSRGFEGTSPLSNPLWTFEPVTLAPKPALAESWKFPTTRLTYTFTSAPTEVEHGDAVTRARRGVVDSCHRIRSPARRQLCASFLISSPRCARTSTKSARIRIFPPSCRREMFARSGADVLTHPPGFFLKFSTRTRPGFPREHVRSIAKFGDPYQRAQQPLTPRRPASCSSGPFVFCENGTTHPHPSEKIPPTTSRARPRLNTPSASTSNPDRQHRRRGRLYRAGQLQPLPGICRFRKSRPLEQQHSPALREDRRRPSPKPIFPFSTSATRSATCASAAPWRRPRPRIITEKFWPAPRTAATASCRLIERFIRRPRSPGSTSRLHVSCSPTAATRMARPPADRGFSNKQFRNPPPSSPKRSQEQWRRGLGSTNPPRNQEYKVVGKHSARRFPILLCD